MYESIDVLLCSLLIIFLIMASSAILYFCFLTPRKRVARHLAFVHKSITDMHPAVFDPQAQKFHAWYSAAYATTKALLPRVKSFADEKALMSFYFAGYEDSHMNGGLSRAPFAFSKPQPDVWFGWMLKATTKAYEVSYSLGDAYPPLGAKLISCNGEPIDDFLQKHFSPYIDKRWHILLARERAARWLVQNTLYTSVLDRPSIKVCSFQLSDGTRRDYFPRWQPLSPSHKRVLQSLTYRSAQLSGVEELLPGFLWVTASDFMLSSKEAYQHYQVLLEKLKGLRGTPAILFDLRGNQGGSSYIATEILKSFFGVENIAFLEHTFSEKLKGADAQFRASWQLHNSYVDALTSIKASRDDADSSVRFLESAIKRVKHALETHEDFFWQSEMNLDEDQPQVEFSASSSWSYQGSVFFLTDQYCSSACLDFIDLLKLIPGNVHLGQPTNADTAYIEVAAMKHVYFKETFDFQVPVKKWNKRMRADNQAYIPDVIYEGDIYNDKLVEGWVKQVADGFLSTEKACKNNRAK